MSVRGGASEECPKLLSLREDTPLLALPDRVELLPSRPDWGLVGEAGIGWRGDCKAKGGHVRTSPADELAACCVEKGPGAHTHWLPTGLFGSPFPASQGSPRISTISVGRNGSAPSTRHLHPVALGC